jgi:UDP-N-acetylmuramoyl-L-alanyl-D-glutamate--2,6-diaminopimelate ligase
LDNALMAVALAFESGVDPIEIAAILPTLHGAQGRLDPVDVGQDFAAFVDYAHSPDSVSRVLKACKAMTKGKVIAVLGCGGDRDSSKRPLMGKALSDGSDIAVFTSDNPRSEDPMKILEQMTRGLVVGELDRVTSDRKMAIDYAVSQALSGDIVVILGKGHESGQESAGVITPFDDRLVLAQAIEARK